MCPGLLILRTMLRRYLFRTLRNSPTIAEWTPIRKRLSNL